MDIIDFRYRPPYGSYRETIMYRDLERARRCSEAFGMTQSPAVAARDMEASLAEMDRAGIGMAVLAGRKVLPHIGVVDNQDIVDLIHAYPGRFSTTIQRETKLFLGADNEETAELTVPMYDFGDWASRMKAYRKKNHITQQELAQLMGVKHFTLRSWEQKQAKPPYNVWRLHKHLFDDSIKLT